MRILIAVAGATLLFSSTAFAQMKAYGRAGTFEVAGNFTFANTTEDYDSGKSDRSETTISPTAGFFLMDGLELLGDVSISNVEVDDVKGSLLAVGAGAGYFVGVGAIRIGPQLLFRYYSNKVDFGNGTATDTGPGVKVGLAAKVPIGTGGLLIAGVNYDYLRTTRKFGGNKEDGSVSGLTTSVGFGIYF